jgi:hypothetical protein
MLRKKKIIFTLTVSLFECNVEFEHLFALYKGTIIPRDNLCAKYILLRNLRRISLHQNIKLFIFTL